MYVIAVASQKGGSGKTTLAGHLAVQADRTGFGPVALVDTDPQGSLSEWWNARTAETPLFAIRHHSVDPGASGSASTRSIKVRRSDNGQPRSGDSSLGT